MVAAVAITRQTHTVEELRALAATVKDAGQSRRLLMIAHVLSGEGRAEAGAATGMDRQAVRDWVQRYTAEGPGGFTTVGAAVGSVVWMLRSWTGCGTGWRLGRSRTGTGW